MQRFVLRQNVLRFKQLMAEETRPAEHAELKRMLAQFQRQLAQLEASTTGVLRDPALASFLSTARSGGAAFKRFYEIAGRSYMVLDPGPGLRIVEIDKAYADAVSLSRNEVIGQQLFDVLPDNPDDGEADGVANLYASLCEAAETGLPSLMEVQRYDLRDTAGRFRERYWRLLNTPIFDDDGKLAYLLNELTEVGGDRTV